MNPSDLDMALLAAQRTHLPKAANDISSVQGKRVLITGAGGSIGSELVRQVAAAGPEHLTLVDHCEFNLYAINCTLADMAPNVSTVSYLTDVRDLDAMRWVFVHSQPQIVLHAAALKHVPMLENDYNLTEAVRTNVLGTKIVMDLAANCEADLVLVSTDKAVNPSSCMGLTKRVGEIYAHGKALRHPHLRISQVRFGNVLGSSGSVVPRFQKQILLGGPVTVTHPDMTRYLMTIAEAVGLILAASSLPSEGYGMYVLDMGKPVKIYDLAVQLIEMAGLRPHVDVPIKYIGVRVGEKLHEELSYEWEKPSATMLPGVMRASPDYDPRPQLRYIDELLLVAQHRNHERVKELLVKIVPEYVGTWVG